MFASVSSNTDPPPLPFNVDNTLGALLIGSLFAAAFWGVTSVQAYIYYQQYPNDRLLLKLVVAILWILDTFDACLTSHVPYHYLVINYMNPASISVPVWSIIMHTAVTTTTDVFIRCLFTKRVWAVTGRSIVLTSIVWLISLCDLVIGLTISARAFQLVSWTQLDVLAPMFYASFAVILAGDLYVSAVLCYYLFKSRTGLRRMDSLVNTLITYIITTGLLTSIDAVLGTTMYVVMPTNYIFMAFYFNLPKLYVNSYLAMLNARRRLRRDDHTISIMLSGLPTAHSTIGFSESSIGPSTSGVPTKVTHRDVESAELATADKVQDSEVVEQAF